jgi:hypothetical protein
MPRTLFYVAVYLVDRAYGGPEEGGWWYDTGDLVRVIRTTPSENKAYELAGRLNGHLRRLNYGRRPVSSVLSDGVYRAQVWSDLPPKFYPETRPHYE